MPPGKLGAAEVDRAAGELGAPKVDRAAGKMGAAEIATIKDNAHEVEVQAWPGRRSVFFEVRGDDPDDGVADFAVAWKASRCGSGASRPRSGSYGIRK